MTHKTEYTIATITIIIGIIVWIEELIELLKGLILLAVWITVIYFIVTLIKNLILKK